MILNNSIYFDEIKTIAKLDLAWEYLKDCSIMITGATGLIGSFLVDLIMYKNKIDSLNITVYAVGRNTEKAMNRFPEYFGNGNFCFMEQDINNPIESKNKVDYIIHGASNTHPVAYSTDPIGTITANILGTKNVLDFAVLQGAKRVVFLSTIEIYGENKGDTEKFDEHYLGYINCNTLRAGYPEGKRAGEAMCQAYIAQYNLDVVIPRLCRVYGPTMLESDSKALAQFIRNAVNLEDIVLKSEGTQLFSYIYVADAISAILSILVKGKKGEAYNISDERSDITLKNLAGKLASIAGKTVVFELPSELERKGFSTATKAILCSEKLKCLGWRAEYDLTKGLKNTVDILRFLVSLKR